jgi:hypothetical protein
MWQNDTGIKDHFYINLVTMTDILVFPPPSTSLGYLRSAKQNLSAQLSDGSCCNTTHKPMIPLTARDSGVSNSDLYHTPPAGYDQSFALYKKKLGLLWILNEAEVGEMIIFLMHSSPREERRSSRLHIQIQFEPHREHIPSPLQRPVG